ncbi:hypothetical protein [Smaragdicoccus niigatensis]|uniref:hypothetical protein n=1 Tax=Smaragdicoccus niigatensis TaxID=359359 RepID=UPI0012DF1891|nr:hypothetical protein [Smaragdicoccus niigatensis]
MPSSRAASYSSALWDYVLVVAESFRSTDRLSSLDLVQRLAPTVPQATIVALMTRSPSPVAKLRMSEAGVKFTVSYEDLAPAVPDFVRSMTDGSLPERFQLKPPIVKRMALGYRAFGSVSNFLAQIAHVDHMVWLTDRTQDRLPLTRGDVIQLRRWAAELAGLPAPESSRYSAARSANDYPSFAMVRTFVRQCWSID